MFPNIRNMRFNQGSQVEPNLEKNLKSKKKIYVFFFRKKGETNYIFLVLPIEEISLLPEVSSPARFRFQGGWLFKK